jgi:hypothetical protein
MSEQVSTTIGRPAADPKAGMSLDELAGFVTAAMRADVPGDAIIHAKVSMRGAVKHLETRGGTVPDVEDDEDDDVDSE